MYMTNPSHRLLTFVFLCAAASPAWADAILDQSFEPPGTAAFTGVISSSFTGSFDDDAQTFTVGMAGQLERVDVLIQRGQPSADLLVDIRPVTAGFPMQDDASAIAAATVPFALVPDTSYPQWVSVDLSAFAPNVTVGEQLALVLRTRSTFPNDQEYEWRGDTGDPYAGGSAYFRSSVDGLWVQTCGFGDCSLPGEQVDWGFKTFVNPSSSQIPEPSTIVLLGLGLVSMWFLRSARHTVWMKHKSEQSRTLG